MLTSVGAKLNILHPTTEVIDWCKENLVLSNPEYAKKVRMNMWTGNTPKTLTLYETDDDMLIVPYGCLRNLLPYLDGLTIPTFKKHEKINYDGEIPLYDYQEKAMWEMYEEQYGILCSPAGSGKTQIGLALASQFKTRVLWLTHTKDLLNQSKERAEKYFPADIIGTITEGEINIGKVFTFATVQTMSNIDLDQYKETWDVIIVDECHRVCGTPTSMTMFSKVLNRLYAKHKYGLSATIHRADGLIQCAFALLGDVVYTVPDEAVADKIMSVDVQTVYTNTQLDDEFLNTDGTINYAKMLTWLGENFERNDLIVENLEKDLKDHYAIVLSDRTSQLDELYNMLSDDLKKQTVIVTGKTKKEVREKSLEDMRMGHKRILLSTYKLAKEGLDIPRLDRLHLATPQKDYAIITQSLGRIARTFDDKDTPVCYDYVDNITMLIKMYKRRCTTYRKLGYRII